MPFALRRCDFRVIGVLALSKFFVFNLVFSVGERKKMRVFLFFAFALMVASQQSLDAFLNEDADFDGSGTTEAPSSSPRRRSNTVSPWDDWLEEKARAWMDTIKVTNTKLIDENSTGYDVQEFLFHLRLHLTEQERIRQEIVARGTGVIDLVKLFGPGIMERFKVAMKNEFGSHPAIFVVYVAGAVCFGLVLCGLVVVTVLLLLRRALVEFSAFVLAALSIFACVMTLTFVGLSFSGADFDTPASIMLFLSERLSMVVFAIVVVVFALLILHAVTEHRKFERVVQIVSISIVAMSCAYGIFMAFWFQFASVYVDDFSNIILGCIRTLFAAGLVVVLIAAFIRSKKRGVLVYLVASCVVLCSFIAAVVFESLYFFVSTVWNVYSHASNLISNMILTTFVLVYLVFVLRSVSTKAPTSKEHYQPLSDGGEEQTHVPLQYAI